MKNSHFLGDVLNMEFIGGHFTNSLPGCGKSSGEAMSEESTQMGPSSCILNENSMVNFAFIC
jgi:hypothetical protein